MHRAQEVPSLVFSAAQYVHGSNQNYSEPHLLKINQNHWICELYFIFIFCLWRWCHKTLHRDISKLSQTTARSASYNMKINAIKNNWALIIIHTFVLLSNNCT